MAFCQNCGSQMQGNFCVNCGTRNNYTQPIQTIIQQVPQQPQSSMTCYKCHSHNISVQTLSESRKTGCGTIILYILLACTLLGLLIVIPLLLRKKTETNTYAVCQNCGYRWRL